MKLPFTKIHAQGNDYIYFDLIDQEFTAYDFSSLAKKYSQRHFGIGSDGIVVLSTSEDSDCRMRIFNADGSEALMCGSALRSTIHILSKKSEKKEFKILTNAGLKYGEILEDNNIEVNIGKADIKEEEIVENYSGYPVDVGNPHFVIFQNLEDDLDIIGEKISNSNKFEKPMNVEWVKIISEEEIEIKIWETGSGITYACGTGASACTFASIKRKKLKNELIVNMPGGKVIVSLKNDFLYLKGIVTEVFRGFINV